MRVLDLLSHHHALQLLQKGQNLLLRERQREALASGSDDRSEQAKREAKDLKDTKERALEALQRSLSAEHDRRKLRLREKMRDRKRQRMELLAAKGIADDDPQVGLIMAELESEEVVALSTLEVQMKNEANMFQQQLNSGQSAKEQRNTEFHQKLADLNESHRAASNELRKNLQAAHDKQKQLKS